MTPDHLRCDHQDEPLVTDSAIPWLSWRPPSTMRPREARLRWTGPTHGTSDWLAVPQAGVPWPGQALPPLTTITWSVQLRDESRNPSDWSSPASFTTGLGSDSWPGPWLACEPVPSAPLLRCQLDLPVADLVSCRWYVAHLGVPRLLVNGQDLAEPGLADYQQDPRYRVEYRVWPVALELLQQGTNVFGCELGGGFHERFGHGRRSVSSFLLLELRDGTKQILAPEAAAWLWRSGPLRFDDPYDGVLVDDRCRPIGWDQPDSVLDDQWRPCREGPQPSGRLVAAPAPLPGVIEVLDPERMQSVAESCRLYDFGRVVTGGLALRGQWGRGKVLTARYAEEATDAGHLLIRSNRQALTTDRFIAGDDAGVQVRPWFSQRGFRYCELSSHGAWPDGLRVQAIGCHDRAPTTATFACAHAGLTQLFEVSVRTFSQNLVGMLRDCPLRDERLGWLGDAHAVIPSVLATLDSAAVLRRWCGLIDETQCPERHIRTAAMAPIEPLHATRQVHLLPPPRSGLAQADNVYTAAGTLLPWQLYQATGDRRELSGRFDQICAHLATWRERPDWPLIEASSHGDHAAFPYGPAASRTPKALVSAAMLLQEFRVAQAVAQVLDRQVDDLDRDAEVLAEALRHRYATAFVDSASSQGTLALGLDLGLCPDETLGIQALRERLRREDHAVGTGIILTRVLLRVLGRFGLIAEAYRLVTRPGCPGWLWMLGGTGALYENLVDDWGFVSRNQPALGVVVEWLQRDLLGVQRHDDDPTSPRWTVVPPDLAMLSWARGSVPTPYGPIVVAWERRGDGSIDCTVDAPAACRLS